jgi:hypothetical protein
VTVAASAKSRATPFTSLSDHKAAMLEELAIVPRGDGQYSEQVRRDGGRGASSSTWGVRNSHYSAESGKNIATRLGRSLLKPYNVEIRANAAPPGTWTSTSKSRWREAPANGAVVVCR